MNTLDVAVFTQESALRYADDSGLLIFDDNGGDPDGDAYITEWSEDYAPYAMRVSGYRVVGYIYNDNAEEWCGFDFNEVAYTTSLDSAIKLAAS